MVILVGWISMWLRGRYMLSRLSVTICVSLGSALVCSAAITSVYNYALRIWGYLGRQKTILTCSGPMKTLALAILSFHSSYGGVDNLSIGLGRWEA